MKKMTTVVAVLAMALSAYAQGSFTVDDVARLAQAGVSDDVIVAKIAQERASFTLSAAQIAALKEQKVSDRVIAALVGKSVAAPTPAPVAGEGNLVVKNASHKGVKVTVNERDRVVSFSTTDGTEAAKGATVEFKVAAGDYRIAIEGSPTRHTATLPATLLVRGADTEYIDVQTITIQDKNGSTLMILNHEGKVVEGQRPRTGYVYGTPGYGGPSISYVPSLAPNILLGAGIGAIIGHQSGHKWEGAAIGAGAGLLFDVMFFRR